MIDQDARWRKLRAERDALLADNKRMRDAIMSAPHNMGCRCLQGGPGAPGWGELELCDCWIKSILTMEVLQ